MGSMAPTHYNVFRSPEPAYHISDVHSGHKYRQHGHETSYPATYVLPHPATTGIEGRVAVSASATAMTASTPSVEDRFYSNRRSGSISGPSYRSQHSLNSSIGATSDGSMQHGHVGVQYATESNHHNHHPHHHHHHHPTLPTLQQSHPPHFPTMMAPSTGHSPELTHSHHMGYSPNYMSSQAQYGNGVYTVECDVQTQQGPHSTPSNPYHSTSSNVHYDTYNRGNGLPHALPSLVTPSVAESATYGPQKSTPGLDGHNHPRVTGARPKPQCWEHGCNGRPFSTFSNLLRHQREKSGTAAKSSCPRCGAVFTRTTARNGHVENEKCKPRKMTESD